MTDVKQNGDYALESMSRFIRGAKNTVVSCTDTDPPINSIDIRAQDGKITTLTCLDSVPSGSYTQIASISGSSTYTLTGTDVTIANSGGTDCASGSSLSFTCRPNSVLIKFDVSQLGSSQGSFEKSSLHFQTTAVFRSE